MKRTVLSFLTLLLLTSFGYTHQVMSWISPYGMEGAEEFINAHSEKMARGLTRIGLQFWQPLSNGGIEYAKVEGPESTPNDQKVALFRDWAHQRKIAVLLCVYNAQQWEWNWGLATSAFTANGGETLAQALVDEMERLNLDGVDLDLEGNINNADPAQYLPFLQKISEKLKARKKILTIDTFHSTCWNAPNVSWWNGWVGLVDQIHSMGYEDLYEGNTTALCGIENIFKYSTQVAMGRTAGHPDGTVLMGIPTNAQWGSGGLGSSLLNHLDEVIAVNTGIAIWEIYTMKTVWENDETWNKIAQIKGTTCGFHPEDPYCTGEDPHSITRSSRLQTGSPKISLLSAKEIELVFPEPISSGSVEVVSISGKQLLSQPFASTQRLTLQTDLTQGLYLVRVKSIEQEWVHKLPVR